MSDFQEGTMWDVSVMARALGGLDCGSGESLVLQAQHVMGLSVQQALHTASRRGQAEPCWAVSL